MSEIATLREPSVSASYCGTIIAHESEMALGVRNFVIVGRLDSGSSHHECKSLEKRMHG